MRIAAGINFRAATERECPPEERAGSDGLPSARICALMDRFVAAANAVVPGVSFRANYRSLCALTEAPATDIERLEAHYQMHPGEGVVWRGQTLGDEAPR